MTNISIYSLAAEMEWITKLTKGDEFRGALLCARPG